MRNEAASASTDTSASGYLAEAESRTGVIGRPVSVLAKAAERCLCGARHWI